MVPVGRLALVLAAVVCLSACSAPVTPAPRAPLDPAQYLLFHNGAVLTMDPAQPQAEALLVEGEKIAAVGSEADLRARASAGTVLIDLDGRTLMPGFVDAHTHVLNDARSLDMSLDQAQTLALRNGITTIGDLYVDASFLREIRAFEAAGALRLRTSLYLVHTDPCGRDQGTWWKAHPPTRVPGEMLRIGGVKIFTDGGSCGAVALSFEHNDQHGGDLWWTQDELNQMVLEVQAAGHQAAIHAIGDRAVTQALAAVAAALNGQPNTYRHRLEHVSVLPPELVSRFGEVDLVPVLPGQYPSCTPFGPPLPEAYGDWEWPWRDLRERNPALNIAWHSDYPFWSINPFVHLYGFVTRRDVYNGYYTCAPQPWLTDDTLTVEQALSIMTLQSAYALFREAEVGSLAPGKLADLIVLSDNPLTVPAEDLRRLSVLVTMVGGQFEHCAGSAGTLCPGYVLRTPVPLPDLHPPMPVRWGVAGLAGMLPLGLALWARAGRRAGLVSGALAAIAGGGLWVAGWWPPPDAAMEAGWPLLVAATFLSLGAAGLLALPANTRLSRAGLWLALLGALITAEALLTLSWFERWEAWPALLFGLVVHGAGLVLFGGALLRQGVWGRFGLVPLLVGLLGSIGPLPLSGLVGESSEAPVWLLALGLGDGWLVLGALVLWHRHRGRTRFSSPQAVAA